MVERVHGLEAIRAASLSEGIPEVLDGLRDPEPVVRFAAALAAGELRVPEARPILLDIVYDKSPSVRAAVRFALHRLGDTRFSHDLEHLASDPNPIVRSNTAMILGLLGEKTATRILYPMRKDPVPAVREQVSECVWRLGDEEGLQELIGLSVSGHPDDQMIGLIGLAEPRDQRVRQHIRGGAGRGRSGRRSQRLHRIRPGGGSGDGNARPGRGLWRRNAGCRQ